LLESLQGAGNISSLFFQARLNLKPWENNQLICYGFPAIIQAAEKCVHNQSINIPEAILQDVPIKNLPLYLADATVFIELILI